MILKFAWNFDWEPWLQTQDKTTRESADFKIIIIIIIIIIIVVAVVVVVVITKNNTELYKGYCFYKSNLEDLTTLGLLRIWIKI